MIVEFATQAVVEYEEALSGYDWHGTGVGNSFANSVRETVEKISDFPNVGSPLSKGIRKSRVRGFQYCLIYQLMDQKVYVLAVAHDKRLPGYWKSRIIKV